ncbi:hypothetical protein EI94DRAFT_1707245 [Lactarius quietus]|nr:hypothetical protein EI94DRAFT_1707245 [Lactarius quietus]
MEIEINAAAASCIPLLLVVMQAKGIRPHRRVPTRRSALHVIPSADTSSLLPPSAPLPCEGALEAHKGRSRACGRRAIFRIVDACPARLEDAEMREVDMECGEHGLGIEWADDVGWKGGPGGEQDAYPSSVIRDCVPGQDVRMLYRSVAHTAVPLEDLKNCDLSRRKDDVMCEKRFGLPSFPRYASPVQYTDVPVPYSVRSDVRGSGGGLCFCNAAAGDVTTDMYNWTLYWRKDAVCHDACAGLKAAR